MPAFYQDAYRPVLFNSPALNVTEEQDVLIRDILDTACSDSRFAQKAHDAIWYVLTHGPDVIPTLVSVSPTEGPSLTEVTITATGTGFTPGSVIVVSGVSWPTTYVSDTEVSADVMLGEPGVLPVAVQATNGVLTSPPVVFTVM